MNTIKLKCMNCDAALTYTEGEKSWPVHIAVLNYFLMTAQKIIIKDEAEIARIGFLKEAMDYNPKGNRS